MTAQELQNRIRQGDPGVTLALVDYLAELTVAVLEVAGERELRTGVNPLSARSRTWLRRFVGRSEGEIQR